MAVSRSDRSREPRIETLAPLRLVGMRRTMTLAGDSTVQLWRTFMPRRGEISNRVDENHYSLRRYEQIPDFARFPRDTEFEKWAAVAVSGNQDPPQAMEALELAGGLYAVFLHRGPASAFAGTMAYIFGQWLPSSDYALDLREHFEILKPGYRPDDPAAEETVWVPIRPR